MNQIAPSFEIHGPAYLGPWQSAQLQPLPGRDAWGPVWTAGFSTAPRGESASRQAAGAVVQPSRAPLGASRR